MQRHDAFALLFPHAKTFHHNEAQRLWTLYTDLGNRVWTVQFSPNEWYVLTLLLDAFPHYVPYAELLAALTGVSREAAWAMLAQVQGTRHWKRAIRPVERAILALRKKIALLHVTVATIAHEGYVLAAVPIGSEQEPALPQQR